MDEYGFAARLAWILKAETLSNGRLAADIEVDKSLVGRWVVGKVAPSAYNLGRLTQYLARRIDGFSLLDWELPRADFEARVARPGTAATVARPPLLCPDESIAETRIWAARYAGIWRTWRLTSAGDVDYLREHMRFTADDDRLDVRVASDRIEMTGYGRVFRHQLLLWTIEPVYGSVAFVLFNGLVRPSDRRIGGILSSAAFDQARTPFAEPIIAEHLVDADWDECRRLPTNVDRHDVPADIQIALAVDAGPSAFAAGIGAMILRFGPDRHRR